ncbi:protein [Escherichia coli]|uniref:Protein n=1 Tax=Escherichia coli TaxID=562 RepID=A0A376MQ34_ECOLX|nr:protein [Escherichia coli]
MKQLLASPSLQLVTYPASATAQSAEFASADWRDGPE